ncbi:hypothetical protein N7463_004169 [Penicillium fimorum]|uniref:Uncharacterized protein n=1 Tax=Penicillium fimorum TaxID=1882269 RepID=A0A9W9Y2I1_9EURO|nr:hypothetical protein N7463_004169 [Penicillium fimorum]
MKNASTTLYGLPSKNKLDKKSNIGFSGLPDISRAKLMRLYMAEQQARPYFSLIMSPEEMRGALAMLHYLTLLYHVPPYWEIVSYGPSECRTAIRID